MGLTSFHHIFSHILTCLSMTVSSELLGQIDLDTQEWTDGVLTFSAFVLIITSLPSPQCTCPQLITYSGFYDSNLKFVGLEGAYC